MASISVAVDCTISPGTCRASKLATGFAPRRFGQGYVTEAVNGITNMAFDKLKAVRMEIRCDARNQRSAAVALRAGYTLEARLQKELRDPDGNLRDTLIFTRLRDDLE